MSALLKAENLELAYGEVAVCRGLSLEINEGEIVALIGANGAGKSTTLRAIAGQLRPRAGSIMFGGKDVSALPSHERAMLGIALVPEGRRVFPFLSARENLELGGFKSRNDSAKVRRMIDGVFDMFPRLRERASQNAGTLSGGEQQMLALGRDIFRTIRTINEAGTSVLLVEQNARYAFETATRGYVLQTGAIIVSGSCTQLAKDDRVREAYLGRAAARESVR